MQNLELSRWAVLEGVPLHVQVLPTDQGLDGAHLQRSKRVLNAETVLASVLKEILKIPKLTFV